MTLLVDAIIRHNIPEGLAIGVAFGAAHLAIGSVAASASVASAVDLTMGIAFQNIPEGVAVAVPLRAEGYSRRRAFVVGRLSGVVEPIAAAFGASRWW